MKLRHWMAAILAAGGMFANAIEVPNASFEAGAGDDVTGWKLTGKGGVRIPGSHGRRSICVDGDAEGMAYWLSEPLKFEPNTAYRLSYVAKSTDVGTGTALAGAEFANVDVGHLTSAWNRYSQIFVSPTVLTAANSRLRFGHWHADGRFEFDQIVLAPVQAIHATENGITLGEGERIAINEYVFHAPLNTECRNHARCLVLNKAGFNTHRWVFGKDTEVIYCHDVIGRDLLNGSVEIGVNYYAGGVLRVQASNDGSSWIDVASSDKVGTIKAEIPKALYPAKKIYVRMLAESKTQVGGADSDPGSFQINTYWYRGSISGTPTDMSGSTRYVEVTNDNAQLDVQVVSLGEGIPDGNNELLVDVTNKGAQPCMLEPMTVTSEMKFQDESIQQYSKSLGKTTLAAGQKARLAIPYSIMSTGDWDCQATLGADANVKIAYTVNVPKYLDTTYGEVVGAVDGMTLWTTSSGWKIPRNRAIPKAKGTALRVSAAANEAEAVQLVLSASKDIAPVYVTVSDLISAAGQKLPSSAVELLRVYYHEVTTKTDKTGVVGWWPDALPPVVGALNVKAGENQPIWVRVNVPKGTPAGEYRGTVSVNGTAVPLIVEVFNFELPDKMTCESAFGFTPGTAFRYHGLKTEEQRRLVLDKYWESFAKHHISPYDPAPLSRFTVSLDTDEDFVVWNGSGIERITTDAVSGKGCMQVTDDSTTSCHSVEAQGKYPAVPVTVSFKYKTCKPGHLFQFTIMHQDDGGHWMSGRNQDVVLTGDGTWQTCTKVIGSHPEGAKTFSFTVRSTRWTEDGSATGWLRLDDVKITRNDTGEVLLADGMEPVNADAYRVKIDSAEWDAEVQRVMDKYHFNTFNVRNVFLGSGTFHARNEPSMFGFNEKTPEYQRLHKQYLGMLQDHFEKLNLLDKAYVYWFDEPDPKDYEFVMNGFRKLKNGAPKIRRMLTEQVEEALVGGPNLWCPVSSNLNPEKMPARQADGDHFWWYVCTGPKAPYATLFIDHPGTELRVWLWQTWNYGVEGILVWASNYWTSPAAYPDNNNPQNPYEDPMGWTSGYGLAPGTKQMWGNGDGRFIYPPEAAANGNPNTPVLDGPVDSIRWEMLRDGIEDYEYFVILKALVAKLPAAEQAKYADLLTVPKAVSASMTDFTTNPAPLEAHRHKLAEAISALRK